MKVPEKRNNIDKIEISYQNAKRFRNFESSRFHKNLILSMISDLRTYKEQKRRSFIRTYHYITFCA